jgi:hypothetical protein
MGCQTHKPAGYKSRLVPKGERTRVRIIDAARLICELGAAGTTLDDVGCDEAMAVLHIYVDLLPDRTRRSATPASPPTSRHAGRAPRISPAS